MEQKLLRQAVELTVQIMTTYYYHRDIYAVLDQMAPDVSWIGPGEQEKKYTADEIRTYFEQGRDAVPSCEVFAPDLQAVDLGGNHCLVYGSMTVRTTPESKMILSVDQRVSFNFRYVAGRFETIHMHISNPYGEMGQDEYFPYKIGSQSYQYLQQILGEKTEVLDMIAGNINGGLKGSNDDSTFSFFYVNEGLPRMLGYTYDEFMEKSGGSAVGAVYPPDLEAALADCERCFAQGSVYSTEYRIEKKDGGLIWVLDSGRKTVYSDGVSRINSIIMDITPLKQALFELEVERERYRIAMEHNTGAMCEYDVEKDSFTLYQQVEHAGKRSARQLEISHFSQKICAGTMASTEDGAMFLDLCMGRKTGTMELRLCLLHEDDQWYWGQFSCSVIKDHRGAPVRAIGILKDITLERERNQALIKQAQHDGLTGLFNHTTVKEVIQVFLTEQTESVPLKCALIMVDLDRFKEVNDMNGHAYGDQVLTLTARVLEKAAGVGSIVGRIGGDEFLILAKNIELAEVKHMTEEMVRQVRKIGMDKGFPVTCSIGAAYHMQQGEPFAQLFERVDQALYHAKNDGRDRAFIADNPSASAPAVP